MGVPAAGARVRELLDRPALLPGDVRADAGCDLADEFRDRPCRPDRAYARPG